MGSIAAAVRFFTALEFFRTGATENPPADFKISESRPARFRYRTKPVRIRRRWVVCSIVSAKPPLPRARECAAPRSRERLAS
jgi:hypothetical protein